VHNFYRAGAQATVTEKERPAAAVKPEEKAKAEPQAKERVRDWRERATEGKGTAEEKGKSALEREHKHTPSEVGPGQSSGQRQMDLKKKQQTTQPEKQGIMRVAPKMMEREQSKQMMEKGATQQKIDQGPSRMERGHSETMDKEKPERGEAAPRGLQ
jgi:hypothetical protein